VTLAYVPCSQTPAEQPRQAISTRLLLPSAYLTASAPHRSFRGSITRPTGPLCTLRSRGRPRTTQHSVPVDGQSLPARDLHPAGHNKRFPIAQFIWRSSPSSRLCLAQQVNCSSPRAGGARLDRSDKRIAGSLGLASHAGTRVGGRGVGSLSCDAILRSFAVPARRDGTQRSMGHDTGPLARANERRDRAGSSPGCRARSSTV
jgi:hypothetical protein